MLTHPGKRTWPPTKRAEIAISVLHEKMAFADACAAFGLTEEELQEWVELARYGMIRAPRQQRRLFLKRLRAGQANPDGAALAKRVAGGLE